MNAHPHPKEFYIAHRWYDLTRSSGWGALSDGPAERSEVRDMILDGFTDEAPTLGTLWVMQFRDDAPPRDVTEDMILEWEVANAPDEDALIEQARCDAADDWVKYQREVAA